MQLGSHNSMSYAKPKKWWMIPFKFMAKCQSVSIFDQYYKYGVRMFDLRVKFKKDGSLCFAHGLMEYNTDIDEILSFLNSVDKVDVRIIQENKKGQFENRFIQWCQKIRKKYPNIKFFGGRNKDSWKVVYKFAYQGPTFLDKYSSVNNETSNYTGTIWDDWFPWLYAWKNNKKNIEAGTDRDYLLIDFVNIQN